MTSKHEKSSDKGKLNVALMSPPCPCFEEICRLTDEAVAHIADGKTKEQTAVFAGLLDPGPAEGRNCTVLIDQIVRFVKARNAIKLNGMCPCKEPMLFRIASYYDKRKLLSDNVARAVREEMVTVGGRTKCVSWAHLVLNAEEASKRFLLEAKYGEDIKHQKVPGSAEDDQELATQHSSLKACACSFV
ncbi:hypothetical protein D5086_030849 [Populus alba]|uniref:Uncharacterized protein n=1 Tax=Populus alba TaxID=43335 RepID=A0ACC4APM8_POPAL